MAKRRRKKKPPAIIDWDHSSRPPTQALPVGFPFVTCRPMCPGCRPCADHACRPVTEGVCAPGTLFYPTTCLPSVTCLPTVPPGCVPRPCTPS
ncbi:hypothetical protein [Anaeroselena agilis]|uniref:Uncharacterized protein n=1 Tax=Anaeroselena agilis TaxID=3063788 RepID=A0ABU3NVF5_9FIRM|nr:hypothetical protein [Selenomonadales bacterium 4137-cl]